MAKEKYWIQESKSYFKEFQGRLGKNLEANIARYTGFIDELAAKSEPDLGRAAMNAGFLGYEVSLLMTDSYCKSDWPNYLCYRTLATTLNLKLITWTVLEFKSKSSEYSDFMIENLSAGAIIQGCTLPLILEGDEIALNILLQTMDYMDAPFHMAFSEKIAPFYRDLILFKLGLGPKTEFDVFAAEKRYEYLAWRYKFALKPSKNVDFQMGLVPDELITDYLIHDRNVEAEFMRDPHFVRLQGALDAIRSGQAAQLQHEGLKVAIAKLSKLNLDDELELNLDSHIFQLIRTSVGQPQF